MNLNKNIKKLISVIFLLLSILISSILLKKNSDNTLKTYVFDRKYSYFLQDINEVSYTKIRLENTGKNKQVIFAKISKPVFVIKDKKENEIYLSKDCEKLEKISDNQKEKLIKLECGESFNLVPQSYEMLKNYNVISMTLIDQRRWQVVILKNEKLITIDFAAGIPNVKDFESLDEKYQLTSKFKIIDLRFGSKIGVIE